jgi:hypothetical protein
MIEGGDFSTGFKIDCKKQMQLSLCRAPVVVARVSKISILLRLINKEEKKKQKALPNYYEW